jgi:hypothetical protein
MGITGTVESVRQRRLQSGAVRLVRKMAAVDKGEESNVVDLDSDWTLESS